MSSIIKFFAGQKYHFTYTMTNSNYSDFKEQIINAVKNVYKKTLDFPSNLYASL